MAGINEITIADIDRLEAEHLSELLLVLLKLEAHRYALPNPDIFVPLNITTPDAGEDGHIIWVGGVDSTPLLPNRHIMFQNKATSLIPSLCGEEILASPSKEDKKNGNPRVLKVQVRRMVDAGGTYILFTTKAIADEGIKERISGFRDGLRLAGHADPGKVEFLVYDSNKIKEWVNQYVSAVTLVQGFAGISRPAGFMTWLQWSKEQAGNDTSYHQDEKLRGYAGVIGNSAVSPKKLRVFGHSGLGKSRLVFEAFRHSPLQSAVVYYDMQGAADVQEIKNYFISHRDHHAGIIIVDNCPAESHTILSRLVSENSKLGLITIGFDYNDDTGDPYIKLDRDDQFDVVEQIIKDKLPFHDPQDIQYLKDLCEGYPWMANRFCTDILKSGLKGFSTEVPQEFIKRLLFTVKDHPFAYEVVRACSVFSSFGFVDNKYKPALSTLQEQELRGQVEYIRTRVSDGIVTYGQFYEICQKYLGEDIIERRGLYYVVKPTILAMNLAADWLTKTDPDIIKGVLIDLKGSELMQKMADRLKDLDQLKKASDLVAELCTPFSFFGSAEVLTSSWGSLLFRYLVEVNPQATVNALYNAIAQWDIEKIKGIKAGRRNLVWALEKLSFREVSFSKAARLLYLLAVGENERWSNNATQQFFQLFQVFLSGTQAPYRDRILILEWGLNKKEERYTRLAIQAIGKAWRFRNQFRMGGAEKQGSSPPLKDYAPRDVTELGEYIGKTMELLLPFATSGDEMAELAKAQIVAGARELISGGRTLTELTVKLIRDIHETMGGIWKEVYDELAKSLEYEQHEPSSEEKIKQLMRELTPGDMKTTLFLTVIKPKWQSYKETSTGGYIDQAKVEAVAFADKVIANNIDLLPFLPDLLSGEQIQTFAFAEELGANNSQREILLQPAITQLRSISRDQQNPGFIAGLIKGAGDDVLFEKIIQQVIDDPLLSRFAFYITQNYRLTLRSLNRLFEIVDKGVAEITAFSIFQYGSILDALTAEELISLCTKIQSYGPDGKWTALCLMFMDAFKDTARWAAIQGSMKDLILSDNFIRINPSPRVMEAYYWGSTVSRLLGGGTDRSFAVRISQQIVDYCSVPEINYNYDVEVFKVVQVLFNLYFDLVWEIFGGSLLAPFPGYYNMTNLLQTRDPNNVKAAWLFEDTSRWPKLIAWVEKNKEVAAKRIAGLMPLGDGQDNKEVWHPFTRHFIDRFGNVPGVLDAIGASMGTFSSSGSTTGYYMTQKKLLQYLRDSPLLEVRDWAVGMLEYTEREILRSQIEDEGGPSLHRF